MNTKQCPAFVNEKVGREMNRGAVLLMKSSTVKASVHCHKKVVTSQYLEFARSASF